MNTKDPTVVFLTAIPLEYQAVKAHLETQLESQWNSAKTKLYEIGEYLTPQQVHCQIIVRQLEGMGNLVALSETKDVITQFQPNYLFFVGIAAKLKDADLGDVVATTWAEGYETGKIQEGEWLSRAPVMLASKHLSEIARYLARGEQWQDKIKPVPTPKKPKAVVAPIVSGEKVVDSPEFLKQLRHDHSSAAAVEMEGLGFLHAICETPTVEGIVIRGISDAGENKAETDKQGWQVKAASHAAAFAFAMLDELLDKAKELPLPPNPYPGLKAFRPEDAKNFFGRDFETQQLLAKVLANPLVVVIGASGSGKSSLVFAGLVPALAPEQWLCVDFRIQENAPSQAPRALVLYAPHKTELAALTSKFSDTSLPLSAIVKNIFEEFHYQKSLLIVIDQFEELYTVTSDKALQQRFLDWLLEAVESLKKSTQVKLRVVLTLRVDFMKDGLAYPPFAAALNQGNDMLGPIATEARIRQVIEGPAQGSEVTLEDGLTERILQDLQQQQEVPLPLLQFALEKLWEQQQEKKLTHVAYEEIGTLKGALSNYAETQYEALKSRGSEKALQHIFTQLVYSATNTKRVATIEQIGPANWALVGKLVDARLVITRREEASQLETVELVHEVLISSWGRLSHWVDESREFRSWQDKLEEDIKRWELTKRDDGALLRGVRLVEAEEKLRQYGEVVTAGERAFIEASVALRVREQQRERRNFQILMVAFVIAMVLGLFGWWQWGETQTKKAELTVSLKQVEEKKAEAEKQKQVAERQTQTALRTQSLFLADLARQAVEKDHPFTAMRLALEALPGTSNANPQRPFVQEASQSLFDAVNQHYTGILEHDDSVRDAVFHPKGNLLLTYAGYNAYLWDMPSRQLRATLSGHQSLIIDATFSPDGLRVVTASWDKTARLWEVATGREVAVLRGHQHFVYSTAFSPDGLRVVTASGDKTARLWEVATGREIAVLKGHEESVESAAFSPDGLRVVTASGDNTARLWEVATGRELAVLTGHQNSVESAAFSPDGLRVVTASWDGTARLWEGTTGRELAVLTGHTSYVDSAAFSPDGLRVVTASIDNTARLWEVATGRELAVLAGHQESVYSAAFSPDGLRVVTASGDKTARLWEVATGRELAVLTGHQSSVNSAAFGPDGLRVVTASGDKTAQLWEVATERELAVLTGHQDDVYSAAFSPDGQRVVTASKDDTARLWEVATGRELAVLRGHQEDVNSAAFSLDGLRVVTASWDNTARLWEVATGRELAVLTGHQNSVYSAAFSPDSLRVVTASGDKTARLWEVATGRELAVLTGHQNSVYSAAFSPDGLRVVTASGDNTARLWEVATGRELAVLTEHKPTVYWKQELAMLTLTGPRRGPRLVNSAAFSPDGLRVVTTSFDKTAQLWEVATGRKLAVLTGHQDDVYSAAFSPDGQRVVTASKDDTARLWEVATGRELAVLAWHQKYVYSAAFSPDGLRVVTASMDNTARLWLVFPNWQEMAAYAQRMLPRTQLTCEERRRFFLLGEGEECRE